MIVDVESGREIVSEPPPVLRFCLCRMNEELESQLTFLCRMNEERQVRMN